MIISRSGSFDLAASPLPFPAKTIIEGFFCHLSFSSHLSLFTFSQLPLVILNILAFLSQMNWSWRAWENKINLHSSVSARSPTEGLGEADQSGNQKSQAVVGEAAGRPSCLLQSLLLANARSTCRYCWWWERAGESRSSPERLTKSRTDVSKWSKARKSKRKRGRRKHGQNFCWCSSPLLDIFKAWLQG